MARRYFTLVYVRPSHELSGLLVPERQCSYVVGISQKPTVEIDLVLEFRARDVDSSA